MVCSQTSIIGWLLTEVLYNGQSPENMYWVMRCFINLCNTFISRSLFAPHIWVYWASAIRGPKLRYTKQLKVTMFSFSACRENKCNSLWQLSFRGTINCILLQTWLRWPGGIEIRFPTVSPDQRILMHLRVGKIRLNTKKAKERL